MGPGERDLRSPLERARQDGRLDHQPVVLLGEAAAGQLLLEDDVERLIVDGDAQAGSDPFLYLFFAGRQVELAGEATHYLLPDQ